MPFNWYLIQENHQWVLRKYNNENKIEREIAFFDGIELEYLLDYTDGIERERLGKVLNKGKIKSRQEINKIKKAISAYVKLIDKLENIPLPNAGDCWYCVLKSQTGQSLGDTIKNNEHLQSHLKEGYIFGAIIWNSLIERGYRFPEVIIQTNAKWAIKNAVRRYLLKRLVIG